MNNLFVTSDRIGSQTGGGLVTHHELQALKDLGFGPPDIINPLPSADPFDADREALAQYKASGKKHKLAHFYSGTYPTLIDALKADGTKVSYTAAAHDIDLSREEHEKCGFKFDLPHLTDPVLLKRYLHGYLSANLVICPSKNSKKTMEKFGCKRVVVISHGCEKADPKPLPKEFTVGYLGQIGPDKGLKYLIQAWKVLQSKNAQLVIAGRNTEILLPWLRELGGGAIRLMGFVKSTSDFYNSCSLYVQPSVTEGFGIEVLEAMSHGRPVICSEGAGAMDCITHNKNGMIVPIRDPNSIARAVESYISDPNKLKEHSRDAAIASNYYTWDKVAGVYQTYWNNI